MTPGAREPSKNSGGTRSGREEADEYGDVVARVNHDWRVIRCNCGLQWILQRLRRSEERVGGRWAPVAYHRSREGLKLVMTRRCGRMDHVQAAIIDQLPQWFEREPKVITTARGNSVGQEVTA